MQMAQMYVLSYKDNSVSKAKEISSFLLSFAFLIQLRIYKTKELKNHIIFIFAITPNLDTNIQINPNYYK